MRTYVTFRHPAPLVLVSDDDGILSEKGCDWFVSILRRLAGLDLREDPCQEDWGVFVLIERSGKKFWVGLSAEEEGAWLAHFHHGSLAWLQRISKSGDRELQRLVQDFHDVLANEAAVSEICWYREEAMRKGQPGSATPNEV